MGFWRGDDLGRRLAYRAASQRGTFLAEIPRTTIAHSFTSSPSLPLPLGRPLPNHSPTLQIPRLLGRTRHLRLDARGGSLPDTTILPLINTILDAVVTLNQVDGVRGEELFGAAAAAGFAAHGAES